MARSKEPLPWSFFAAGGMISAYAIPIMIVITGLAGALGWIRAERLDYDHLRPLAHHWIVRLGLLVIFTLTALHCAHRMKFTLAGLTGLKFFKGGASVVLYLLALGMSACAALALWKI